MEGPIGQDGDPEIAPEKDRLLFSAKGTKTSYGRIAFAKKWCWNNQTSIGKKNVPWPKSYTFIKINTGWM